MKLTKKQDDTLNRAIDTFGNDAQIEMVIEECAELIMALQKLKRDRGEYTVKIFNVCDELADVTIMLNQAHKIFEAYEELIQSRIDFKINRLEQRIIDKIM